MMRYINRLFYLLLLTYLLTYHVSLKLVRQFLKYLAKRDLGLCFRQSRLGGGTMFSACPSGRPSVCYESSEHDILKTNEPILLEIGTSSLRGIG